MTPPKKPTHYDSDLPPEPLSDDTPPEPVELAGPPEPDDLAGPEEPEPPAAPAPARTPAPPPPPVPAPPPPAPVRAAPAAVPEKAAPVAPGPAAPLPVHAPPPTRPDARERQRAALAAEIHNPRGASRKAVIVPAAVLLLLLVGGGLLVHVWASAEDASRTTLEEVKTPQQKRLEQERALQEVMPTSTPAELAELPPEPSDAQEATGTQPATASGLPAPRARRSLAPSVTQLPAPSVTQLPAPSVTQLQDEEPPPPSPPTPPARRSLATSMAVGFADASPSPAASATVPRGTFLHACLTSGADPSHPAPFTATVSADVMAGAAVAVPRNSTLVCTAQGLTASRLAGSCDTLTVPGRGSLSFSGLVYGKDRRAGLPVVITGGPGAGDDTADSALATAERVLGAVSPGGLGGELLQGAAGTGGRAARSATRSPEASARPLPPGTCFLVFVDQPFRGNP